MKAPPTPFPTVGYYGPEYFCNREEETKVLLSNTRGGLNTILVAPRRMGKTALIHHLLSQIPKKTTGIYLDILPTENLCDFLNAFATAVIRSVPDSRGAGRKLWDLVRSLRPVISFDSLTGSPQVSFDVREPLASDHATAIMQLIEQQKTGFLIAIDEFQQILKYPEKNTDAWLRTRIQEMKNVVFIFSGSHQHLMNEMFSLPSRPFYKSANLCRIGKIDAKTYAEFIRRKFLESKRNADEKVVGQMLDWTDGHTYYVQLLCNRVYLNGARKITEPVWMDEAYRILKENEQVFFSYRNMLTIPQWELLKAIALEGEVREHTSKDFIFRHKLGSPATVLRSLHSLTKMELIYHDFDPQGKRFYKINDLLFRRWMEHLEGRGTACRAPTVRQQIIKNPLFLHPFKK